MAGNIVFREDGTILVKNVRLSYPHLFQKYAKSPKEVPKYSGRFLLDKTTHAAEIKELNQYLVKFQNEHFKGRIPNPMLFHRNGAETGKPELENCWYIQAREDNRPTVINKDKSPITEADDIVYAGCYVNVLVRPWKQDNEHGKRLNANLLAVQFVKDGERFSTVERPDVDEVFEDESGGVAGAASSDDDDDGLG